MPRSGHAAFTPAADRADPIALLEEQAASRVPELVPIRYGRMLGSAFAFYRGVALIMAADRRHLLGQYRLVQQARKVVGVGSVGTWAWIGLLMGRDGADPLFLQPEEAQASVLERFLGRSRYRNSGQRVVAGQRRMQAASDIFLGAAGRWPGLTPAPGTGSRSPPTSAGVMASTAPSWPLPRPTPTRTSATTGHCRQRSRTEASTPRPGSETPMAMAIPTRPHSGKIPLDDRKNPA